VIRAYIARLKSTSSFLWFGILPVCAAITLNVLILLSSQGKELLTGFAENRSLGLIAVTRGSLCYPILCSWGAIADLQQANDPPGSTLLPYIVAGAVAVSGLGFFGITPLSYWYLGSWSCFWYALLYQPIPSCCRVYPEQTSMNPHHAIQQAEQILDEERVSPTVRYGVTTPNVKNRRLRNSDHSCSNDQVETTCSITLVSATNTTNLAPIPWHLL
jgi:hypothetical protein